MNFDLNTKYRLKQYVGLIADENYYNQLQGIIRINFNGKFFDFKYLGAPYVPNPKTDIAIIVTSDEFITDLGIPDNRLSYLPGTVNGIGNIGDLPIGFVFTMPKKQTVATTNPQNGSSGFSVRKANMMELDKVRIALSPHIDTDYTSTENSTNPNVDRSKDDPSNKNIGIFMNDDVISIKTRGGQITLGDEGIHLGGNIAWESSEHQREWMMDNPLHRFIPATIVTFAVSIPELPNISKFAKIAEGAKKVRDIGGKIGKVTKLFT